MKISELVDNIVTETIEFRGHKVEVKLKPDCYTIADAQALDEKGGGLDLIIEYVLKGLHSWDITGEDGEEFPKDIKTIKSQVPEQFVIALFDRIIALKNAAVGKLRVLKG